MTGRTRKETAGISEGLERVVMVVRNVNCGGNTRTKWYSDDPRKRKLIEPRVYDRNSIREGKGASASEIGMTEVESSLSLVKRQCVYQTYYIDVFAQHRWIYSLAPGIQFHVS